MDNSSAESLHSLGSSVKSHNGSDSSISSPSFNKVRNVTSFSAMLSPKARLFQQLKNTPVENSSTKNTKNNMWKVPQDTTIKATGITNIEETKRSPVKNLYLDFISEKMISKTHREDEQHRMSLPARLLSTQLPASKNILSSSVDNQKVCLAQDDTCLATSRTQNESQRYRSGSSFITPKSFLQISGNVNVRKDLDSRKEENSTKTKENQPLSTTVKPKKIAEEHRLRNWVIKALKKGNGIAVQGHRVGDPPDQFWHSTGIVNRCGNRRLSTASGSVYILIGPIDREEALDIGLPKPLIAAFRNGFPPAWKELWQQYTLKNNGNLESIRKDVTKQTEKSSQNSLVGTAEMCANIVENTNLNFNDKTATKSVDNPGVSESLSKTVQQAFISQTISREPTNDILNTVEKEKHRNDISSNSRHTEEKVLKTKQDKSSEQMTKQSDIDTKRKNSNNKKQDIAGAETEKGKQSMKKVIDFSQTPRNKPSKPIRKSGRMINKSVITDSKTENLSLEESIDTDAFKTPENKPVKSVKERDKVASVSPKQRRKTDLYFTPPMNRVKSEASPSSFLNRTPGGNVDLDNLPVSRSGRKIVPQLSWWTGQRMIVSEKIGSVFDPGTKNSFIETGTPSFALNKKNERIRKKELNKRTKPHKPKRNNRKSKINPSSSDNISVIESQVSTDQGEDIYTADETTDGYMSCDGDIQEESQVFHSVLEPSETDLEPNDNPPAISNQRSKVTIIQLSCHGSGQDSGKASDVIITDTETGDSEVENTGRRKSKRQQKIQEQLQKLKNELIENSEKKNIDSSNNSKGVKNNKKNKLLSSGKGSKDTYSKEKQIEQDCELHIHGSSRRTRSQTYVKGENVNSTPKDASHKKANLPDKNNKKHCNRKSTGTIRKNGTETVSDDILAKSSVRVQRNRPRISGKARSKSTANVPVKVLSKSKPKRQSMGTKTLRTKREEKSSSSSDTEQLFTNSDNVKNTLIQEEDILSDSVSNYDLRSDILGMLEERRNIRLSHKPPKTACYNSPQVNMKNVMQSRRHSEKYFLKKALLKNASSAVREKVAKDSPVIMLSPLDDNSGKANSRKTKSRLNHNPASVPKTTSRKRKSEENLPIDSKKVVKTSSGNEKYGRQKSTNVVPKYGNLAKKTIVIDDDNVGIKKGVQINAKKETMSSRNQPNLEEYRPWTAEEMNRLKEAVLQIPAHLSDYWHLVASLVETRTALECQTFHYRDVPNSTVKKRNAKKPNKPTVTQASDITGKTGTMKRKRQLREFMDHHEKDHEDDLFSSTPYRNAKTLKLNLDDDSDEEFFNYKGMMYQTPGCKERTSWMPVSEKKTPLPSFVSPGILKSVNRNEVDTYINRLKKSRRMFHSANRPLPVTGAKSENLGTNKPQLELTNVTVNSALFTLKEVDSDNYGSEEEEDNYFSDETIV